MDAESKIEIDRPRSAPKLIGLTFRLYGRYPLLFFVLAAGVGVPYLLIVLAITGDGPFSYRHLSFLADNSLTLADLALVVPLVSALHVHAVLDISEGKEPRLADVARRSLRHLPLVALVVVISWLGTMLGFLFLVVPGVLLSIYWSVVAQTAALEGGRWKDPFNRSESLAEGNKLHVLGLVLLAGLIPSIINVPLTVAFHHSDSTVLAFVVATATRILSASFSALATATLFFDLKARARQREAEPDPAASGRPLALSGRTVAPTGHPLDPGSWTDEDRPPGWYIDPDNIRRMRHWAADGTPTWGKRQAKTPRTVRSEFVKRRPVES